VLLLYTHVEVGIINVMNMSSEHTRFLWCVYSVYNKLHITPYETSCICRNTV